ncbi:MULTISPECIES: DUF7217 family protein [unclassified Vibrio]|uniref:DUF7217 family protein n=1 Tax=unclassified Vibrio TaxID=2614977 RepID=UPI0013612AEB|nr:MULTISPECIES: hypothetical protein [unclassified Vibrio]NAW59641.1 hypothetical protein [Vibrio sp. V36_P2S2PM302]NAX25019.1 hypothetical protein [Vibrio sp. V38_P2S17PM301]NAX28605.1 hypothetical protein [Vibrio sp. V37_P2S8PM304]
MNDDLYNEILQNGLGLNSPSLTLTSSTLTTLGNANTAVDSLPIAAPPADGVTQELVDATHAAINGSLVCTAASQNQMQTHLDQLFATINCASGVNRIEDVQGCDYLMNATGSLLGDIDEFLNGMTTTAQQQMDAIARYVSGEIDTAAITQILTDLNGAYAGFESRINAILASELTLMSDLTKKLQSSSLAKSVSLLWSDPCAQAVLDHTLSPDIKDILNGV